MLRDCYDVFACGAKTKHWRRRSLQDANRRKKRLWGGAACRRDCVRRREGSHRCVVKTNSVVKFAINNLMATCCRHHGTFASMPWRHRGHRGANADGRGRDWRWRRRWFDTWWITTPHMERCNCARVVRVWIAQRRARVQRAEMNLHPRHPNPRTSATLDKPEDAIWESPHSADALVGKNF